VVKLAANSWVEKSLRFIVVSFCVERADARISVAFRGRGALKVQLALFLYPNQRRFHSRAF
jgi:hypothetical protein